ncbi:MAG: dipeptide epimerase [Pseudomonadota bacterium]|nr:dipeptide epimerase [Pseudomonadota bacterium]
MSATSVRFLRDRVVLNHTFGVSRESYRELNCMFAVMSDGEHSGLGEATEFMPTVYGSGIEDMLACEPAVTALLDKVGWVHPTEFHPHLEALLPDRPFVRCAVDVAYWDLYARRLGKPLFEVLGFENVNLARSNYSIGLASVEDMQLRAERASAWPAFKVKLGRDNDIDIVRAIRAVSDKPIVVDANCGWTLKEAIEKIHLLAELGVTEVEQPLPSDQWGAMKTLKKISPVALIADESCTSLASLEACVGAFDKINAKLMKSGGITPVLRLFERAAELGLRPMLGCMPETPVGIAAICQFAPIVETIEIDSVAFVVSEHATGVAIENGTITLDNAALGTSAKLALKIRPAGPPCSAEPA